MSGWPLGDIERINLLMRARPIYEPGEVVLIGADDVRFGPGVLIPLASRQSYAQDVLDAIGRQVEFGLDWNWPGCLADDGNFFFSHGEAR